MVKRYRLLIHPREVRTLISSHCREPLSEDQINTLCAVLNSQKWNVEHNSRSLRLERRKKHYGEVFSSLKSSTTFFVLLGLAGLITLIWTVNRRIAADHETWTSRGWTYRNTEISQEGIDISLGGSELYVNPNGNSGNVRLFLLNREDKAIPFVRSTAQIPKDGIIELSQPYDYVKFDSFNIVNPKNLSEFLYYNDGNLMSPLNGSWKLYYDEIGRVERITIPSGKKYSIHQTDEGIGITFE